MRLRRYGVGYQVTQKLHGVAHDPRLGVVDFQVQMRTCGVACVATDGYQLACLDRELRRWQNHRQRVVALTLHQGFVFRGKALQMAVDAGMAVRVVDVDGVAKPIHANGQPADVALGNGKNRLSLLVVGLDVQSAMKVPRTWFTEIACQRDFIVDRT